MTRPKRKAQQQAKPNLDLAMNRMRKIACRRAVGCFGFTFATLTGSMFAIFPIFPICFTNAQETGVVGLVTGGAFPI